jgi:indolepyruvate ferredoxin oxidoreductase
VDFLTGYQDAAYAQRFRDFVQRVREAEQPLATMKLSEAVAQGLFKLMAYKDEYEVARLHTDPVFEQQLGTMFEGDFKVVHHMAPPLLAKKNARGEPVKQSYGPWMRGALKLLARMKGLRGTALDVFGRTAERREERALIEQYRACIEELLSGLTAQKLPLALQIARIPQQIRGFGHVKAHHLAAARREWDALMAQWRAEGVRKAA